MVETDKSKSENTGPNATPASASGLMRIGELAERLGVSARTIRYYEGLGLIQPARRRGKGYRYFDAQAMERMTRIQELKRLGLSLDDDVAGLSITRITPSTISSTACNASFRARITRRRTRRP